MAYPLTIGGQSLGPEIEPQLESPLKIWEKLPVQKTSEPEVSPELFEGLDSVDADKLRTFFRPDDQARRRAEYYMKKDPDNAANSPANRLPFYETHWFEVPGKGMRGFLVEIEYTDEGGRIIADDIRGVNRLLFPDEFSPVNNAEVLQMHQSRNTHNRSIAA